MNNIKNDINLREAVRRREQKLPPMPANLNEKVMGSLPISPSERRGNQTNFSSLSPWRERRMGLGGLIAAGIALLIVQHYYNNKVEPTDQPVVAEVFESESPQPVPEPAPEPVVEEKQEPQALQPAAQPIRTKKRVMTRDPVEEPLLAKADPVVAQAKPQEKPKGRVARTAEPVAIVKQEEKPEVAEENLLAEVTPPQEQTEELPVLPPKRQALVDMFMAEEALQVAYMQQEQTKELRAFTAGLEGKEPETSHLITSF